MLCALCVCRCRAAVKMVSVSRPSRMHASSHLATKRASAAALSLVVIGCNDAIKQACRRRRRLHGMGVVLSLSVPARLLGYESFYGAAHNTQSGRPEQYSPSLDMR